MKKISFTLTLSNDSAKVNDVYHLTEEELELPEVEALVLNADSRFQFVIVGAPVGLSFRRRGLSSIQLSTTRSMLQGRMGNPQCSPH